MPFDENKPFCIKCWNEPNMENPLIATIIIAEKGVTPTYRDLCKNHLEILSIWLKNKKKNFGRSGYKKVGTIEQFFPEEIQTTNEEKPLLEVIPMEKRKQYLDGKYIGKYAG